VKKQAAIELLAVYECEWLVVLEGMRGQPVPGLRPKFYADLGLPLRVPDELEVPVVEMRRLSPIPALAREQLKSGSRMGRTKMVRVKIFKHPPEERLFFDLLRTRSARRVREVCRESKFWLNPKAPRGRPFVGCLYKNAGKLVKAKSDPRYPKSARPSSLEKRLRFLARALAGITVGMSPRRAINILEEESRRNGAMSM
jgi:hypothetical protein